MLFAKQKTWVVVADGAQARIFENIGRGKGLSLLMESASQDARTPTSEQGAERPGTNASGGTRQHAMNNPVDWQDAAKHEFLKSLAGLVNDAASRDVFDALVVVAAPKALGDLRQYLDAKAHAKLAHELNKDLTQLKPDDLCVHLKDILRL